MSATEDPAPRIARALVARAGWVVLGWVALTVVLNLVVPQIEEVAARDSSAMVPEEAPSMVAVTAMGEAFGSGESESFVVVAMERTTGLRPVDKQYAVRLSRELREDESNVAFVQDVRRPEILEALTSRDGEARYLLVGITGVTGAPASIRQVEAVRDVADEHRPDGLAVAVTGPTATVTDVATEAEESVLRITVVTVVLIGLILLVIYRSLGVMLLILTVVGLGLGLARAVTAWCGIAGVFTVSTFSGSFLTAVVLGAATDYAVFLLARYHEGRRAGLDPDHAAALATSRVGAVVAGSAVTVVLATSVMALAHMGIFRTTGPAVAVSVAVNLAISLTLTPALLTLAGRRGWLEPKPSRVSGFWRRVTGLVAARPGRMLVASLVPLLALAAFYPVMDQSYDMRDAQPEETESNLGYAMLDRHFPVNEVLPDYVLVEADHDLRNARDLALLERAAASAEQQPGVVLVRGITRPLGRPIEQASLSHQSGIVGERLGRAGERLEDGEDGARRLVDGAEQLSNGADRLASGSGRLAGGARQAAGGAGRIADGTGDLAAGIDRLLDGAEAATRGTGGLRAGADELATGLEAAADQVAVAVDGLGMVYDALATRSLTCGLDPACRQARDGLRQIWVAERDQLLPGLREAAAGARSLADGAGDLGDGLRRLRSGLAQARAGADRLAEGQRVFAARLDDLADGASRVAGGVGQLADGAGQVAGGTEQVASSLPELRRGLQEAAAHLRRTARVGDAPAVGGFYLPPTALKRQDFAAAARLYLSPDGRTARIAVLGGTDAFGRTAAARTVELEETVEEAFHGTRLEDATVSTTGMASTNHDLAAYSAADFRLIAVCALVAVFLVLLLLLRSVVAAGLLVGTVVLSYASAIGLAVLVWQVLLGQELEWTVAPIAFVILVAVGADYNLLLTKRMHEEAPDGSASGIARATIATGGVITTAGVIFAASTFAMMAATVTTVTQVGFTIGCGLLLDTFVVRSLLVPALATLLGPRLWWPQRTHGKRVAEAGA